MINGGFILLHRSLLNWEWYKESTTRTLFIHLLLTVNYEPQPWQGIVIKRGQRVASYGTLASETGLSIRQIRTAIAHLKTTGEVTHTATSKYGLFTVENYDKYQMQGMPNATQTDSQGVTQATVKRQSTDNNGINNNKSNKAKEGINIGESFSREKPPRSHFVPPEDSEAIAFFIKQGSTAQEASAFLDYYFANGWVQGKSRKSIVNWQAAARNWIRRAESEFVYDHRGVGSKKEETIEEKYSRIAADWLKEDT